MKEEIEGDKKTPKKSSTSKKVLIDYINSKKNTIDDKTKKTKVDLLDEVQNLKIEEYTREFLKKVEKLKSEINKDKELNGLFKTVDGMNELIKKYEDLK